MAQAAFIDLFYKYCVECAKLKFTLADVLQLDCLKLFHQPFCTYRVIATEVASDSSVRRLGEFAVFGIAGVCLLLDKVGYFLGFVLLFLTSGSLSSKCNH